MKFIKGDNAIQPPTNASLITTASPNCTAVVLSSLAAAPNSSAATVPSQSNPPTSAINSIAFIVMKRYVRSLNIANTTKATTWAVKIFDDKRRATKYKLRKETDDPKELFLTAVTKACSIIFYLGTSKLHHQQLKIAGKYTMPTGNLPGHWLLPQQL